MQWRVSLDVQTTLLNTVTERESMSNPKWTSSLAPTVLRIRVTSFWHISQHQMRRWTKSTRTQKYTHYKPTYPRTNNCNRYITNMNLHYFNKRYKTFSSLSFVNLFLKLKSEPWSKLWTSNENKAEMKRLTTDRALTYRSFDIFHPRFWVHQRDTWVLDIYSYIKS